MQTALASAAQNFVLRLSVTRERFTGVITMGDVTRSSAATNRAKGGGANHPPRRRLVELGALRNADAAPALLAVFMNDRESEKIRDSAAHALTALGATGKLALEYAIELGDDYAQNSAKTYLRL